MAMVGASLSVCGDAQGRETATLEECVGREAGGDVSVLVLTACTPRDGPCMAHGPTQGLSVAACRTAAVLCMTEIISTNSGGGFFLLSTHVYTI